MIDVNNDILTLFNKITLDIRDYLFDKSQKTGEQFICENGTYKTVTFALSNRRIIIEILRDHEGNNFINIYIGNKSDKMVLISTVKNKFTVNCIPDSCSIPNYFQYHWKNNDIEKSIDIARTRFHEYSVKINSEQKEHNFKIRVITDAIDPYIDDMSYIEIEDIAYKLRSMLDNRKEDIKVIDDSCVRYLEDRVKELKEQIEEIEQRHYEELDPIKQELEDTERNLAEARSILDMQKQEQE
jgi:hypothetical protein